MTWADAWVLIWAAICSIGFRLAMLGFAKEEQEQRQAAAPSAAQRSDIRRIDVGKKEVN